MQETRVRFAKLPAAEQARLSAVYGPQPESGYAAYRIAYVRELTPYESWFFGSGNFLSPSFMTQTLYKLKGTLLPLRFNRALRDLDLQEDILRTNYCNVGDRMLAVVAQERKNSEPVVYYNLQGREPEDINAVLRKTAGAALRFPFNIEKGGLLRIYVFHTGQDEYAVMVTAAQIIMDRFDVRAIFYAAQGQVKEVRRSAAPHLDRSVQMEARMRDYWKDLLDSPPRQAPLPGELANVPPHPYKQMAFRLVIPGGLFSDMMAEAKGNRMMMMSFLTTAWGLYLATEGQLRDLCSCLIVPERNAQGDDTWRPFRMVPARQTIDGNEQIGNMAKRQFQQLLVSLPYACFDWEGFGELMESDGKPFNHFLDFNDFLSEEKPYSAQHADPDGNVVAQHSWDAQSMKLSLYFRYKNDGAFVIFLYDEDSFAPGTGERLSKGYLLTLQRMIADRHASFDVFQGNLRERLLAEKRIQAAYKEEERARLQNAASFIFLLQGAEAGTTQLFTQAATLQTYFEGDRIEDMDENLLFVVEGKLVRSIKDGEGWYRTLNIVKEGAWLNEGVLLEERKAEISIEVLSERAAILAVPKTAMKNILTTQPALWKNITGYVIAQLENFQRLWAQS